MVNFPSQLDDDSTIPPINGNITEIGEDTVNSLRDAVFNIESEIGIGASGTSGSISTRLGVSLYPDGYIKPSALAGIGLVSLPIDNSQISATAGIEESKLDLDVKTSDLYNYIQATTAGTNTALNWINSHGVKLEPHISGSGYNHNLSGIDVSSDSLQYLKNKLGLLRDNSNSYTLLSDINNDFIIHQKSDGTALTPVQNVITNGGGSYPDSYGHHSAGIYVNTSRFRTVPQTINDVQSILEFIDNSSLFLAGERFQNLTTSGISRASRSKSFILDSENNQIDGYNTILLGPVDAIAYLRGAANTNSSPVDDINFGDDLIELLPTTTEQNDNSFDAKFNLVSIGDIIKVNYGTVEYDFIIKEKKYSYSGGKKYIVRLDRKNIVFRNSELMVNPTAPASVVISKSLFNDNKQGVLAVSAVDFAPPSLIIGNATSAMVVGTTFNANLLGPNNYYLYLVLYPTGNPQDGYKELTAIDVTGNRGTTPGQYTLKSVVNATNDAFRTKGYNYRFMAFEYQGSFGIMMTDSYRNAGFSIISNSVEDDGSYTNPTTYLYNVIDTITNTSEIVAPDALGFGPSCANVASPPWRNTFVAPEVALIPTKIFQPHKRNNFYVDAIERDRLSIESTQTIDEYGDGYWVGQVILRTVISGSGGRVATTFRIPQLLDSSGLANGKTLTIIPLDNDYGNYYDFGRFIISGIQYTDCGIMCTDISVYDAIHYVGSSPQDSIADGYVAIYFDSSSVGFNTENATDISVASPFNRYHEVYVKSNGETFTHERMRYSGSSSGLDTGNGALLYSGDNIYKINVYNVSPKLRGYSFGSIAKIGLNLTYNSATTEFSGYLCRYDGTNKTRRGPISSGRRGDLVRFYDESTVDYIDIKIELTESLVSFTDEVLDFQLFPTLQLDDQYSLLATCLIYQNVVKLLNDKRQFGNISEKDFSTSAIEFINSADRLIHTNGVFKGFDLAFPEPTKTNPLNNQIKLTGGSVFVNGKVLEINEQIIQIPPVKEVYLASEYNVNIIVCINKDGDYENIIMLDYDQSISSVNNPARNVILLNKSNSIAFNARASTFSNLISNLKDLVPLYIIAPVVVTTTESLRYTDVRRFISNTDNVNILKYSSLPEQGNFRSMKAMITWLNLNGAYNGVAYCGNVNETITSNETAKLLTINPVTNGNVIIDGQNNSSLTIDGHLLIGGNVTIRNFDNITFVQTGSISNDGVLVPLEIMSTAENVVFENCTLTFNINYDMLSTFTGFRSAIFINSGNVKFINCTINATFEAISIASNILNNVVYIATNSTQYNYLFDNTDFIVSFPASVNASNKYPGTVISYPQAHNLLIKECSFTGSFKRAFFAESLTNVSIDKCDITSTYNPVADSGIYDPSDKVNYYDGMIYCYVTGDVVDFTINNCKLNYNPVTGSVDRFPFISLEFIVGTYNVDNINIINNKFYNLNLPGNLTTNEASDLRPAICLVTNNFFGTSIRGKISNNICNQDNMILVTQSYSFTTLQTSFIFNDFEISNNICGTIGYLSKGVFQTSFASREFKASGYPNLNLYSINKSSGLVIKNNTCHLIANLAGDGILATPFTVPVVADTGIYVKPSGAAITQLASSNSGNVFITNNKCNWITVSNIHDQSTQLSSSTLTISDNSLVAFPISYYFNHLNQTAGAVNSKEYLESLFMSPFLYAIYVFGQQPADNNFTARTVITNNMTSHGYYLESDLATYKTYSYGSINSITDTTRYFFGGYVNCQTTCLIDSNIFKGFSEHRTSYLTGLPFPKMENMQSLIIVGGNQNTVTNNIVMANAQTAYEFVRFQNTGYSGTLSSSDAYDWFWNGSTSSGIVSHNNFTSNELLNYVVNITTGGSRANIPKYATASWKYSENINQTYRKLISLTEGLNYKPYDGISLIPGSNFVDSYYQTSTLEKSGVLSVNDDLYGSSSLSQTYVLRGASTGSAGRRVVQANWMLSSYLNPGIKIRSLKMFVKNMDAPISNNIVLGDVKLFIAKYWKTNELGLTNISADAQPPTSDYGFDFRLSSTNTLFSGLTGLIYEDDAVAGTLLNADTASQAGHQLSINLDASANNWRLPNSNSYGDEEEIVVSVFIDLTPATSHVVAVMLSPIIIEYSY